MTISQRTTARAVAVVIGMLTAAVGVLNAQAPVPGLATWKLNVAKSKFSPGPPPKAQTVTFLAAGQGVKGVIDGVAPDGKIGRASCRGRVWSGGGAGRWRESE